MQKTDRSDRGIKADAGSRAAGNTETGRTAVINKKSKASVIIYWKDTVSWDGVPIGTPFLRK